MATRQTNYQADDPGSTPKVYQATPIGTYLINSEDGEAEGAGFTLLVDWVVDTVARAVGAHF